MDNPIRDSGDSRTRQLYARIVSVRVAIHTVRFVSNPKCGGASIDKAIAAIEASTDAPELIRLQDFVSNALKSLPED